MPQYVLKHRSLFLELGEVMSEGKKTYIVESRMVKADGTGTADLGYGGRRQWSKKDVMPVSEKDFRAIVYLQERRREVERQERELRKELGRVRDSVLAWLRDRSTPHEHVWRDEEKGTACRICGEAAISEKEAAAGLENLFS